MQQVIQKTYDPVIANKLKKLQYAYDKSPAVQAKSKRVEAILKKNGLSMVKTNTILKELMPDLIPPGATASIKGSILNKFINARLRRLPKRRYEVKTEHNPAFLKGIIHERPDWVVKDNMTQQTIVGFTQTSILGGGQQLNRASKYILDESLHTRLKKKNAMLVCVIVDKPIIAKKGTKSYEIVHRGITKNRLVLPRGLIPMITSIS